MLAISSQAKIYLYAKPVDMRKSFDVGGLRRGQVRDSGFSFSFFSMAFWRRSQVGQSLVCQQNFCGSFVAIRCSWAALDIVDQLLLFLHWPDF